MSIQVPAVAREYFAAASAFDVDRTVALFAEEAVVRDEGKDIRGREAIHQWVARTMREYSAWPLPSRSMSVTASWRLPRWSPDAFLVVPSG